MALTDKYQSLISMAQKQGLVTVDDQGDVLHISGTVDSEATKQSLWDEYGRLDPEMRSGDLVLTINVSEAGIGALVYEVKEGDTLSKIAGYYPGVSWRAIFEANRDQIDDPDMIYPGQQLQIPKA